MIALNPAKLIYVTSLYICCQ